MKVETCGGWCICDSKKKKKIEGVAAGILGLETHHSKMNVEETLHVFHFAVVPLCQTACLLFAFYPVAVIRL